MLDWPYIISLTIYSTIHDDTVYIIYFQNDLIKNIKVDCQQILIFEDIYPSIISYFIFVYLILGAIFVEINKYLI